MREQPEKDEPKEAILVTILIEFPERRIYMGL